MNANERKTLFVHIGMHKTGTSSIQYMLHSNLSGGAFPDYLFPATGREGAVPTQHAYLANAFLYPEREDVFVVDKVWNRDILLNSFVDEMKNFNGSKCIISSESLCLLSLQQIENFADTFSDYKIVPIFYVRKISDYTEKFHQTMVQMNFYSRAQLCDPNFKFWESHMGVNVFEIAQNWSTIASDGKVWVADYDSPGQKFDSVALFMKVVGLDPSAIKLTPTWMEGNKSQSPLLTLIKIEMLKSNIAGQHIDGLIAQLSNLNLSENQTLLPQEVRQSLDESYSVQLDQLKQADFAKMLSLNSTTSGSNGHGFNEAPGNYSSEPSAARYDEKPIYLEGLASAVFALGRAVSKSKCMKN